MNNFLRAYLTLVIIMSLAVSSMNAQEFTPTYKWKGEIRLRSEADGRDFNNLTPFSLYTLSRIRLGFEAVPVENVRAFIQAQDSRVFGSENDGAAMSTLGDSKNLDIHQGYIEINQLFCPELMMRLGRQELSYGNERLVGSVGFHNIGRSFDGALFRLTTEAISLDAFAMNTGEYHSYSATATPAAVAYVRDNGQNFYGSNLTLKNMPEHKMDFYAFYQWNRHQTVADKADLNRITLGTYQKGNFDVIDYEAEFAYQGGKIKGADISTYLLSANFGYKIDMSPLSKITLGCDYLSGTPSGDMKFKAFDPIYHTGHKFYGFMDYFINIPANTANAGLIDFYARAGFKFSDQVDASLWIHQMSLSQEVNGEKGIGQEVDITTLYKYNKFVAFDFGLSAFIPGHLMQQSFGHADVSWWGYVTTTVTF